jgi:hypothetical protein
MKHLFFLIALICGSFSYGQTTINWQGTTATKTMSRGFMGADSGIINTPSDTLNHAVPIGMERFRSDFSKYVFTGVYWKAVGNSTDTSHLSNRINGNLKISDTAAMLLGYAKTSAIPSVVGKVNYTDTAAMLLNYAKSSAIPTITGKVNYTDTAAMLANYAKMSTIPSIVGKVNYTDTATMLANYAKTSAIPSLIGKMSYTDTAAMLLNYAKTSAIPSITGKMNYTDTAAMLLNYAKSSAIPSTAGKMNYTDTAAMLINYAKTSAMPSIVGKVNFTDTAAMLTNYLHKADTAAKWVTNLYRKSGTDSVFKTIGGITSWAFKDSTGGGGSGWNTNGNSGLNATANFIGTKDAVDLVFKTNNGEQGRITANGGIAFGQAHTVNNASYLFGGYGNTGTGWLSTLIGGRGSNVSGQYGVGMGSSISMMHTGAFIAGDFFDVAVMSTDKDYQWKTRFRGGYILSLDGTTHDFDLGGSTHPSAALAINSTSKGVLLSKMTNAQKGAIVSPESGLEIYCTDCTATDGSTGVKQVYNGSGWKNCW